MLKLVLKEGCRWVLPVWYARWFLWLALFFVVELINQFFIAIMDGFEARQAAFLIGGLLTSTLDFTLAIMVPVVLMSLRDKTPYQLSRHFKKYFNQACIESVRSTARICWYSYLLVIPGLVKFLRLLFVPYIVQFDQKYDSGAKDALKESEKLSKGFFLPIFFIFTFCSMLLMLEGVRSLFPWNSPYFALAFILTLPLRIYTQIVWFLTYEYLSGKVKA